MTPSTVQTKLTSPTTVPKPGGILVFGAHPDDIEFGCGGVIAQETRAGATAHLMICTRGESATQGTPEQRSEEAQAGARCLGATVEFLGLGEDAHLEYRLEHVLKVAAAIRQWQPRSVLAPTTAENQHPDHAVLGRMVRDAARLARYGGVKELRSSPAHAVETVLAYAVTTEGEPPGSCPVWIDVSRPEVMGAWKAAMEAHASQLRTRNYVELQLTRARLNGLRAGVEHAIALFPNDPLVFSSITQLGKSARRF